MISYHEKWNGRILSSATLFETLLPASVIDLEKQLNNTTEFHRAAGIQLLRKTGYYLIDKAANRWKTGTSDMKSFDDAFICKLLVVYMRKMNQTIHFNMILVCLSIPLLKIIIIPLNFPVTCSMLLIFFYFETNLRWVSLSVGVT